MKPFILIYSAALFATTAVADENRSRPREIFMAYFEAMEARQVDAAKILKSPECSDTLHMNIHNLNIVARLQPFYEMSTSNQALVVAAPFSIIPAEPAEAIYAELVKLDGAWRLQELARTDPNKASWLMQGFRMHADVKLDVSPHALVGHWHYPCASSVVMNADGSGSEFPVGPVGPAPDQQPEPFTWTIDGTTLTRTFADRKDQRIIIWIDHRSASFKPVPKLYDTKWGRKTPKKKKPTDKGQGEEE